MLMKKLNLKKSAAAALVLSALASQAWADPSVSILATPDPAVQGSTVGIDILVSGISDLYGYQFSLNFNPAILQVLGVTEGSFLSTAGSTFGSVGTIDNTAGQISYIANTLLSAVPGANGSGVLAHIDFNVTAVGSSALSFSDALFLNSNLGDITVQLNGRTLDTVAAVPEPSTYLMLAAGLVGLVAWRRRQPA